MTYYGFGHGVGMSQCGAVGYAAERNMGYKAILRHYYKGASITSRAAAVVCSAGCAACLADKMRPRPWYTA